MGEVEELEGRSRRLWNLRTRGKSGAKSSKRKCGGGQGKKSHRKEWYTQITGPFPAPRDRRGSDLTSHRRAHQENRDGGLQRQGELPDFSVASN